MYLHACSNHPMNVEKISISAFLVRFGHLVLFWKSSASACFKVRHEVSPLRFIQTYRELVKHPQVSSKKCDAEGVGNNKSVLVNVRISLLRELKIENCRDKLMVCAILEVLMARFELFSSDSFLKQCWLYFRTTKKFQIGVAKHRTFQAY